MPNTAKSPRTLIDDYRDANKDVRSIKVVEQTLWTDGHGYSRLPVEVWITFKNGSVRIEKVNHA